MNNSISRTKGRSSFQFLFSTNHSGTLRLTKTKTQVKKETKGGTCEKLKQADSKDSKK